MYWKVNVASCSTVYVQGDFYWHRSAKLICDAVAKVFADSIHDHILLVHNRVTLVSNIYTQRFRLNVPENKSVIKFTLKAMNLGN